MTRPIGAADRARAALHVLDWIGCAAAGARTPPGMAMIAYGRTMSAGCCHAFGGLSLAQRDAALVNGAFGNVLEMDDLYRTALVHPGPVVVPAALAAAEATGASAQALLDAVICGFEAMIRVGRSVGPSHYQHFHNTATCGVFGSAVAAGSLLGLDEDRLVHALGNAGTQASGLWQCRIEDTMSKQLHNGRAAQSGLLAAELAVHGFTGAEFILEGPLGFYAGLCPDGDPDMLLDEPDAPWLIHGTSFKPWPACRHTHPTIDAVLALRQLAPAGCVRRIIVESYRDALTVCDNPHPRTPVEAKFSMQHASAVVLLRGKPRLEDFDMNGVRDPDVAALRNRIELREHGVYTSAYPAHFGASVSIECADGQIVRHDIPDALGDPENPLSPTAISDKARILLKSAGYTCATSDAIVGAALALADGAPIANVTRLLL
ncbi:MAG: MmgE/PrpD family protein [Acetobacteraceae bacterium]